LGLEKYYKTITENVKRSINKYFLELICRKMTFSLSTFTWNFPQIRIFIIILGCIAKIFCNKRTFFHFYPLEDLLELKAMVSFCRGEKCHILWGNMSMCFSAFIFSPGVTLFCKKDEYTSGTFLFFTMSSCNFWNTILN